MKIDASLLKILAGKDAAGLDFLLHLQEKPYRLRDVSVADSPTPVSRPTTRGGAYFAEKSAYRVIGTVHDLSIMPLLSDTMLGPNAEFSSIRISTTLYRGSRPARISMHANLASSIQKPGSVELHMILVGLGYD